MASPPGRGGNGWRVASHELPWRSRAETAPVCWPLHHRERWVREEKKTGRKRREEAEKHSRVRRRRRRRQRRNIIITEERRADPRSAQRLQITTTRLKQQRASPERLPPPEEERDAVRTCGEVVTAAAAAALMVAPPTVFVFLDAESCMSSNLHLSSDHPPHASSRPLPRPLPHLHARTDDLQDCRPAASSQTCSADAGVWTRASDHQPAAGVVLHLCLNVCRHDDGRASVCPSWLR